MKDWEEHCEGKETSFWSLPQVIFPDIFASVQTMVGEKDKPKREK